MICDCGLYRLACRFPDCDHGRLIASFTREEMEAHLEQQRQRIIAYNVEMAQCCAILCGPRQERCGKCPLGNRIRRFDLTNGRASFEDGTEVALEEWAAKQKALGT